MANRFGGTYLTQGDAWIGNTFNTQGGSVHIKSNELSPGFFAVPGVNYESWKNSNPPRAKDTCVWFLEHPQFRAWRDSDKSALLWLTADPGCGKSVLSRALIDENLLGISSYTCCYFFFKENELQSNVATALCAILHQLFSSNPSLLEKHAKVSVKKYEEALKENFEELWRIFMSVVQDESESQTPIICLFDALDECQKFHREKLIEKITAWFKTLGEHGQHTRKLKMIATSRPYYEIEQRFRRYSLDVPTVRLAGEKESSQISAEISKVIDVQVGEIARELDLTVEVEMAILHRLQQTPNRTYLWLYLTLNEIRDAPGRSERKLLNIINTLSETLEQAYEKILQKCWNRDDATKLLQIVIAAHRPLTVREIDVALEVSPQTRCFNDLDLEYKRRDDWIRSCCGLFVSVIDDQVVLIHETARNFLVGRNVLMNRSSVWKHSIDLTQSRLLLAQICVTYLHFPDWNSDLVKDLRVRFKSYGSWSFSAEEAELHSLWFLNRVKIELSQALDADMDVHGENDSLVSERGAREIRDLEHGDPNSVALNFDLAPLAIAGGSKKRKRSVDENLGNNIKSQTNPGSCDPDAYAHRMTSGVSFLRYVELHWRDHVRKVQFLDESWLDRIVDICRVAHSPFTLRKLQSKTPSDRLTNLAPLLEAAESGLTEIVDYLLGRHEYSDDDLKDLSEAVASNSSAGLEMMAMLTHKHPLKIKISTDTLYAAVRHRNHSIDILQMLVPKCSDHVRFGPRFLWEAARNADCGLDILRLMLKVRPAEADNITIAQMHEIRVSHGVDGKMFIKEMLEGKVDFIQGDIEDAAWDYSFGREWMEVMLNKWGKAVQVTHVLLSNAVRSGGADNLAILLERRNTEVLITDDILQTAVQSALNTGCLILLLIHRCEEVNITKKLFEAAAHNEKCGCELIQLLIRERGHTVETEALQEIMLVAAQYLDDDTVSLVMDMYGTSIELRHHLIAAAAQNRRYADGVMKLFLKKWQGNELRIAQKTMWNAATNLNERRLAQLMRAQVGVNLLEAVKTSFDKLSYDREARKLLKCYLQNMSFSEKVKETRHNGLRWYVRPDHQDVALNILQDISTLPDRWINESTVKIGTRWQPIKVAVKETGNPLMEGGHVQRGINLPDDTCR